MNRTSAGTEVSVHARVVSDSRILSGSQRKSVARGPLSSAQSKQRLTALADTPDVIQACAGDIFLTVPPQAVIIALPKLVWRNCAVTEMQAPETGGAQPTAPARLDELKAKMRLDGTVKRVELYGAFVDVGVGRDGLVHISQLRPERVNNVADVVREGETVTVWVKRVDAANGRLDLTMIQPLAVDWIELKRGQVYTGKVTKVEKFGAFVDIGAERPGLVHVSEMATYRVEDPADLVKAGGEVRVQVLGVDAKKKQIKLSMKAIEMAEMEQEEDAGEPEEELTAMQLAFKRAQSGRQQAVGKSGQKSQANRQAQEDLLSRTLSSRRK
jgi:transcriptional accessory protein Tex/SPT6